MHDPAGGGLRLITSLVPGSGFRVLLVLCGGAVAGRFFCGSAARTAAAAASFLAVHALAATLLARLRDDDNTPHYKLLKQQRQRLAVLGEALGAGRAESKERGWPATQSP